MTLAQMRARVRRMVGVKSGAVLHWTDAEIDRRINDAYRKIARRTGALEMRYSTPITGGTGNYTLPDAVRRVMRVTYDDRCLVAATTWAMDRLYEEWEEVSGYVEIYIEDRRDNRTIRLYRTPDSQTHTDVSFSADTANNSDHTDADHGIVARITGEETFTFAGDESEGSTWIISTAYVAGDRVETDGVAGVTTSGAFVCIKGHTSSVNDLPGVGVDTATYWRDLKEFGIVARVVLADGEIVDFQTDDGRDSSTGTVAEWSFETNRLAVWAKRNPPVLELEVDVPELPLYSHLGICYAAASELLRKRGAGRNRNLSKAYDVLADEHVNFLRKEMARRVPEKTFVWGKTGVIRERNMETDFMGDDYGPIPNV